MEFSFEAIVENANDVIWVVRVAAKEAEEPRIVYVNTAFSELTGYAAEEAIGRSPALLDGPDTTEESRRVVREAMVLGRELRTEVVQYTREGRRYSADLNLLPLRDGVGHLRHYAAIVRDLTEEKAHERLLLEMATTDPLTGLANRRQFVYRSNQELARSRRYGQPLSLVMFDIDHFKQVNDTHGHAVGDFVLREVANVCRTALRECDVFGRIGGEEYAIALPETAQNGAFVVAERLRRAVEEAQFEIDGAPLRVTASFGVAVAGEGDRDSLALLNRADAALYDAKRQGRNRVAA